MKWQQIHTNAAAAVDGARGERPVHVRAAGAAVIAVRVAWGANK